MIITKNGTITTTTESTDHYPYPCPPCRNSGRTCEEGWKEWAKQNGKKIRSQDAKQ